MAWIIDKSNVVYKGGPGYKGIICDMAGVQPGAIYHKQMDASADCAKMDAINPIGWKIYKHYYVGDEAKVQYRI